MAVNTNGFYTSYLQPILATIAIQFYWNYKNYTANRQRVINEIQLSFDTAIEEYYASLAKTDYITVLRTERDSMLHTEITASRAAPKRDFTISEINVSASNTNHLENIDSVFNRLQERISDSSFKRAPFRFTQLTNTDIGFDVDSSGAIEQVQVFRGKKASDSIRLVKNLRPIFIALMRDSIQYTKVDSLLRSQLDQKNIDLDYSINHYIDDALFYNSADSLLTTDHLTVSSKSTFIRPNEGFKLQYNSPSKVALQRSSTGILFSLLLALAVISSLFYLLKIINQQKALAEIKNDLISNITHEFKTPIATVSTAVEAMQNFNAMEDIEKTKKYLNISSNQLNKLNNMVEKLLETATLDGEKLLLSKEKIDLVKLVERLVQKYKLIAENKELGFSANIEELTINADEFHIENAISNLIDNAIKYGGDKIDVVLTAGSKMLDISVTDNGKGIEKGQSEKIFHKFYRIPKGNIHDVKGFGIGLYYSKKIVEKHGGALALTSTHSHTTFKISLPNG